MRVGRSGNHRGGGNGGDEKVEEGQDSRARWDNNINGENLDRSGVELLTQLFNLA